jgi:hypothetical protein
MVEDFIEFAASAFKHGIVREDILHAFRYYRYDGPLKGEGYEDKSLRLGVDRAGNLIEIIYHEIDERTVLIFHAMKCQSKYYHLLKQ